MKFLNAEQLERFERDGFLVIENFLSAEETARVKADIARVSDEVAHLEKDERGFNFERQDGAAMYEDVAIRKGVLRKIQGAVQHVPAVKDVFAGDKMLDCMEDLMGPNVYYHSSKVMFKPPGGVAKPWHQDAAYWRQFAPNQITVWIAIDDASEENGCVWAIPGSHKLGLIPHVKRELQVEESRIDLQKAIPVPVPAGGLLIFHSLVLHMSERNNSDKTRWAIICDYDCLPNPATDIYDDAFREEHVGSDNVWPLRTQESAVVAV
jgi:ectoine hydroxylase-related dioxygenase (phytanoyl-CoA dioxygenase family)